MNRGRVKEILDFIVAICSIVSCIVAVYGVFQVVDFVIDVRPIVVPIAQEVKDGKLDAKSILTGSRTTVKYDTMIVTKRDTIYLPLDKEQETSSFQHERNEQRQTSEEQARLGKAVNHVSEQEQEDIDNQEASFRQRMRNKMKQNR